MNDTLELLEHTVFSFERSLLDEDLEYRNKQAEYLSHSEALVQRHKGNRALIHELGEILDAYAILEEHKMQFRLFLALQMGMELRDLHMIPFEWELSHIPFPRRRE